MAWATVQGVRELTRNLQVDDARIQAAIRMAQSHVRANLSRLYPTLTPNQPAPDPIPLITEYLAAALVEANTLAITQVGATQNPYALQLYQQAMELLEKVRMGFIQLVGEDLSTTLPLFVQGSRESDATGNKYFRRIRQHRRTGAQP